MRLQVAEPNFLEVDRGFLVVVLQADKARVGPRPACRVAFTGLVGALGLQAAGVELGDLSCR